MAHTAFVNPPLLVLSIARGKPHFEYCTLIGGRVEWISTGASKKLMRLIG